MANQRVWLDSHDCGLVVVEAQRRRAEEQERQRRKEEARQQQEEAERVRRAQEEAEQKRREETAKRQVLEPTPQAEFLPPLQGFALLPDHKTLPLQPTEAGAMPSLDLSHLLQEMRSLTEMMNLTTPEERIVQTWFGCDTAYAHGNTRVQIKTERGRVLADYAAAHEKLLAQAEKVLASAGARQRAQYQLHIDQLNAVHTIVQLQNEIELARQRVQRQNAMEDAKARAIIAGRNAFAREAALRGYPPPPPPPPTPAPIPEDPRAKNKARLQAEVERLRSEEAEDIGKVTGGKPEAEWPDAVKDEVVRIQNMYEDARDQKRGELRDCL